MARNILISWIGFSDLEAAGLKDRKREAGPDDVGPIVRAIRRHNCDVLYLLDDLGNGPAYLEWLKSVEPERLESVDCHVHKADLKDRPTDLDKVYLAAVSALEELYKQFGHRVQLTYLLSAGTPSMSTIWVLLSQTEKFGGELIETRKDKDQEDFRHIRFPFHIAVDYAPRVTARTLGQELEEGVVTLKDTQTLRKVVFDGPEMEGVKHAVARAARLEIPVLIMGETGTGKELVAKLIHENSECAGREFVPVNCGAIPRDLLESELFGHEKGAFTSATTSKMGLFEKAEHSTLFLDEIGEMSFNHQAKLLRALQEKEFTRVGGTSLIRRFPSRVIAATNRDLMQDVVHGRFREDLLYRLAVVVIQVPPLRKRKGHLKVLIDRLRHEFNEANAGKHGFPKHLDPRAEQVLLEYEWPGNVREMDNTIKRCCWLASADTITKDIVESAIMRLPRGSEDLLNLPLNEGFNLTRAMARFELLYLKRALDASGTQEAAAKMLGFNNHQTFKNHLEKCEELVEELEHVH